eukprot:GHVH01000742.1.p1 GENE.GHVH01000742.1~~GHVH01000742.1.p1  ORF type:complete len:385 (+),score=42.54 GHVH01000742.1:1336-2490(+)
MVFCLKRRRQHTNCVDDGVPVKMSLNNLLPIGNKREPISLLDSFESAGYEIVRPLARQGGQSKTFLIRKSQSKKLYVGKVIAHQSDNQYQEIALLKRLKHPHVVKLIAHWTTDDEIVIVMEFCAGGDLSSYIQRYSQPSTKWIIRWMSQLCLGLHFVHLHNVIHFDLKASNVFLDRDLCVKLGDFGVSCVTDEHQPESNEIRGTLSYLSPEMLQKRSTLTWASDCWALGCLLHELLYEGQRAFPLPPSKQGSKMNINQDESNKSKQTSLFDTKIGIFKRKDLLMNIQKLLPGIKRNVEVVEDAPGHRELLSILLDSLLRHEPEERPSLSQVLHLLYAAEFGVIPQEDENMVHYPPFQKIMITIANGGENLNKVEEAVDNSNGNL